MQSGTSGTQEQCLARSTSKCHQWFTCYKGKGKVNHAPQDSIGECSSPSSRPWARRWRTTNVCDAWPVRRQTYCYLPSRQASPPIGWYQIILLGDRHMCVNNFPGLHSTAGELRFEPTTYWSQVRHLTTTPPSHSDLHEQQWKSNRSTSLPSTQSVITLF